MSGITDSSIIHKLCRYKKLIDKVFRAKSVIQPYDSFDEDEREKIDILINETSILSKDSEDNIWFNPDMEKAFDTMLGSSDNIDLGRIGEYIESVKYELGLYMKKKRDLRVIAIVKYFNSIISLLEDNSKLVTRKRESDYGGYLTHVEKVEYVKHLLSQTLRLADEVDTIRGFIDSYNSTFLLMGSDLLRKKIIEVRGTVLQVRQTLVNELGYIESLVRHANEEMDRDEILEKLKIIDFLMGKGRFFSETNYEDLHDKIPTTVDIDVTTHLNSRYAYTEEYPERVLSLSREADKDIIEKKRIRPEAKARERSSKKVEKVYIDVDEIYHSFMEQSDKSLLRFIESIDFGETIDPLDVYLEVLGEYHDNFNVVPKSALIDTQDGEYSVLDIKNKKENV